MVFISKKEDLLPPKFEPRETERHKVKHRNDNNDEKDLVHDDSWGRKASREPIQLIRGKYAQDLQSAVPYEKEENIESARAVGALFE